VGTHLKRACVVMVASVNSFPEAIVHTELGVFSDIAEKSLENTQFRAAFGKLVLHIDFFNDVVKGVIQSNFCRVWRDRIGPGLCHPRG